nr:immunoglobulin heavy chain junction region [Mus musculus]
CARQGINGSSDWYFDVW